ncbi:hypothetical protein HK101_003894, partial [Irineochytrium annulatum]
MVILVNQAVVVQRVTNPVGRLDAPAMITESQACVPGYTITGRIETPGKPALFVQRAHPDHDATFSVVCKSTLVADEDENRRSEREYEILRLIHNHHDASRRAAGGGGLTTVDGDGRVAVPVELVKTSGNYVLIVKDFKGVSLREFALGHLSEQEVSSAEVSQEDLPAQTPRAARRRLSIESCLRIGQQLVEALHLTHSANVIHKDVNPDNVIVRRNLDTGGIEVQLIDFNLAEVTNDPLASDACLNGTLPYMSPEQTGRTTRKTDNRSDIYSFGITLWELLVGEPPFTCSDAMEYVHCHLAKESVLVSAIDPLIPTVVSEIVSKCLAKNPERRYQSAMGLLADINACVAHIGLHKTETENSNDLADDDLPSCFSNFQYVVGCKDFARQIQVVPGKLYGRAHCQGLIYESFDRIAGGKSASEVLLLEGSPGSGKNALVAASVMELIRRGGRF